MGTGIVATPNDFGVLGGDPTIAEAARLAGGGVHGAQLERQAHRPADRALERVSAGVGDDDAKAKIDPDNKLYWRMNRKRLDGETMRDSVLAASGALNPRLGGQPVRVPIEQEVYDLIFTEGERDDLWPLSPDEFEQYRRSLYLLNKRTVRLPMMAAFDQPDTMTSCPVRPASTHALQALVAAEQRLHARAIEPLCGAAGARMRQRPGVAQLRRAYKLALARAPQPVELELGEQFLRKDGTLADFCLALLNRNEFVYVP